MLPSSRAIRPRYFFHATWVDGIRNAARILLVSSVLLAQLQPAQASPDISAICEVAADTAARRTGVPVAVLKAISLTETGRKSDGKFAPWPWTVNMEGKGEWFDTRAQAEEFAGRNFRRGARSFDVGCFQLNYKWHGRGFSSIEEMFDPTANAVYAAKFLRDLYIEKGNWPDAAGAYHSRTPEFSSRYRKRFNRILARLESRPVEASSPTVTGSNDVVIPARGSRTGQTINSFPLLQSGSSTMASLGSLMPASAGIGARRLFGGG